MTEQGGDFLKQLKDTGFFEQVGGLQSSLSGLSEDIAAIGDQASQRLDEMESLAAHVMAIEAVLAVMMKKLPVDGEELKAMVIERTAALTGDENGSPTVQAVAADLIA